MPRPRIRLPLWKRALFAGLLTAVFFTALELLLAVAGVKPVLYESDPYVGFSSRIPLFVESQNADGQTEMVTAENKVLLFNRQKFPQRKAAGTYRIFGIGGSTTYGHPYDDKTSFCGWLRQYLPAADDSRAWEVVNAGGISYASYREAMLMEELARHEPDLFIIYTGHNEFLERRTYASMFETPSAASGLGAVLSGTRTYSALKALLHRSSASGPKHDLLPGEVDEILQHTVGPESYSRDDDFQQQVMGHFRFSLSRMVDIARSAGAAVILVTPASNLGDCSPFKSEHRAGLSEADRRRWQTLFDQAQSHQKAGAFDPALAALDAAAALDDRFAHLHYLRGRVLKQKGRYDEAQTAFVRARDEDVCPLRAPAAVRDIMLEVARDQHVPVVDSAKLTESRSEHGIPGDDQFLDHVHPTIEGYRRLALDLIDQLVADGVVVLQPSWGSGEIERVKRQVEAGLDRRAHGIALRTIAQVYSWSGKIEEARKMALRALELADDDAHTNYMAGMLLLDKHDLDKAIACFRRATELEPVHVLAHVQLGAAYAEKGRTDEALACYHEALRLNPNNHEAQLNLGLLYVKLNKPAEAASRFQRAVELDPESAPAHRNLGKTLAMRGDLPGAIASFQRATEIRPEWAAAHNDLGKAYAQLGDFERASASFARALELNPESANIRENLQRARKALEAKR